jgi:hypothetical protein
MEGERLEPLLSRDDLGFAERCDFAVTHGFYSFFTFELMTVPDSRFRRGDIASLGPRGGRSA